MNESASIIAALLLLSGMLTATLTIAWSTLGRDRHAALWAWAFGVSTAQWGLLLAHIYHGHATWLLVLAGLLSITASILIAAGFRRRSGLPERRRWLIAVGAAVAVSLVWSTVAAASHVPAVSLPLLFRAAVLVLAAAAVIPRDRRGSAAECATVTMLWLFITFNILAAAASLTFVDGSRQAYLAGAILMPGLPAVFAGTGLFTVFLLAADLAERMRMLAAHDPLTGILNRRGFEEAAARLLANAARHGQTLSLAIADIDRFKAVNDAHGHAVGDAVLRRFATEMGDAVRLGDLFGRLGGEEFVLLLVNTPGPMAVAVLDRLRTDIACQQLDTHPPHMVTTSFGVAELASADETLDELMARADHALYQSKLRGRDRVSLAPADDRQGSTGGIAPPAATIRAALAYGRQS